MKLKYLINEFKLDNAKKGSKDTGLSEEAFLWLDAWSWDASFHKYPSIEIIKEFSKYKPNSSVILYRGTTSTDTEEKQKRLLSFTYEKGMAEAIIDDEPAGRVIELKISLNKILVDVTKIPKYKKYFINEVIVFNKSLTI